MDMLIVVSILCIAFAVLMLLVTIFLIVHDWSDELLPWPFRLVSIVSACGVYVALKMLYLLWTGGKV